jgi:hypothetical protein
MIKVNPSLVGEIFILNQPPTQQKTPLVIHSSTYCETQLGLQGYFLIFQSHFQRDRRDYRNGDKAIHGRKESGSLGNQSLILYGIQNQ